MSSDEKSVTSVELWVERDKYLVVNSGMSV